MDLIGKKVLHNKFGEGFITEQDASYVSVKFLSKSETKEFQYPSCFKTFLKLLDADVAVKTDEAVKLYEEEERQKKQKEMEEAEVRLFTKKMQKNSGKFNKTVELRLFNSVDGFCDEYKRAITSILAVNGSVFSMVNVLSLRTDDIFIPLKRMMS